ncbi:MAG: phosphoglycerate dehydrogenase [Peptostreptococcaceae bacterium]|nr:phosphoglycerate dehydrogenase [Peptostreptococcaceae bacterium]
MEKFRVLVAERISDEGLAIFEAVPEIEVDVELKLSRNDLLERISDYDALVVRSKTKVNGELINKAGKLKIIGRAGNGIDNIDIEAATLKGVLVANTPESNTMSAAELAIGLLLAQSRNIPQATAHLKNGKWDRNLFKGTELYGKTLGIIGFGRIGSLVSMRMRAFGMKIVAYDPYVSDERFEKFHAEKKETVKELVEVSDFITVHTPKTEETIGMIGEKEIGWMKKGVRLVNDARGGIINEKALYNALKDGSVASAGIDVFETEPSLDNPLFKLDNIVVTPHLGASTHEAQQNVGETIARQVIGGLRGEIVPNAVNLPALNRENIEAVKPYLKLAEQMGKLYYQLNREPVESVAVSYYGDIAGQDVDLVTLAFLKGLLEPVVKEGVNYVNAQKLAEDRGIHVRQKKDAVEKHQYRELMSVKVKNGQETFEIAGNLSAKKEGRIVYILGYEVDVNPTEYMMFIQNMDVPGVIGRIGTILGKGGVNIATMQVGRNNPGEKALMVLNVDGPVSAPVLDEISGKEDIMWAESVKL